jgi:folate-binding protein YgfZ
MIEHHCGGQNRTHGICNVLARDRRRGTVDGFKHRGASGMNVATGCHAEASLQGRGKVSDYVAEHVVGDNHVERMWFANHLQTECVHVHVLRRDVWIFGGDFFEDALPESAGVAHDIGLVAHQDLLAPVLLRVFESETNDSFHSLTSIDVFLRCDFVGCVLLEEAAHVHIDAFGVLANHRKVDLVWRSVFQGAEAGVEQLDGTDVRVEIHLEAHAEKNLFSVDVGFDAWIAEGSDENRIEVTIQHLKSIGGDSGSVFQIAVSAPVKRRELHLGCRRANHLERCGDDFFPYSVTWDDCDPLLCHGPMNVSEGAGFAPERDSREPFIIGGSAMPVTSHIETLASSGAQIGEYAGAQTPASFGDAAQELDTLRSGVGVYDLSWRGKLVVTGEDRVRWMNGMVTNNVRDLPVQHGTFGYILNPQGRIQADATVFHRGDYLLLTSEASQLPKIKDYFDRYIIMDDVEISDVSEKLVSIGVAGPLAAATLTKAELLPKTLAAGAVVDSVFKGIGYSISRSPIETSDSYEVWFAPENFALVWDAIVAAGAKPVGSTAVEWQRMLNGLPRIGIDIGERELPQETGQEYALHYAKGCYIGQEIVERIHSRGNVNRVFSGLQIDGNAAAERGTKIVAGDKEIGEVTSSAVIPVGGSDRVVALGYLRREASAPGTSVKIGEANAMVVALPFKF